MTVKACERTTCNIFQLNGSDLLRHRMASGQPGAASSGHCAKTNTALFFHETALLMLRLFSPGEHKSSRYQIHTQAERQDSGQQCLRVR